MIDEGKARIDVGEEDDVFYNPRMEMNRDITVAVLRAWHKRENDERYVDAMSATGIRGLRAALETPLKPIMNDRSESAVEKIRENLEENRIDDIDISREDANVFLHSGRYEIVDIDPFGSPIPFADSAFNSAYSLACFTATDTAPLCGAHDSGPRRYMCQPLNTEYHPEMGLRVLIGALVRTAARYDVAATPVLSHVSDHYVRTYLEVESGAKKADSNLESLGYISHCFDCYYRSHSYGTVFDGERECPNCSTDLDIAGPVWLDGIREKDFVDETIENLEEYMGSYKRAKKTLRQVRDEIETPTHYDQHKLCQKWEQTPEKIDRVVEKIRRDGYEASRTHYSGQSFKTELGVDELEEYVGQ